jgi:hypothetical protein
LEKKLLGGESLAAAKQNVELHAIGDEGRGQRRRIRKSLESDSDEVDIVPVIAFYIYG